MSDHPRLRELLAFSQSLYKRLRSSLGDSINSLLQNSNQRKKWLNILLILLLVLFVIFANVRNQLPKPTPSTVTLNATIYLPTASLKPILQSHVDQQFQSDNQGWLGSLIHPTITNLTPQSDGLAMTVSESLIQTSTLLKFSVLDPSTIQVSAQQVPGSSATVNGPLAQIKVPAGHLNSISPTPMCGDSALATKMGFPISTGQKLVSPQAISDLPYEAIPRIPMDAANAYVEVPSSALSKLGEDLGSVQISQTFTAQNIRMSIQNNEIVAASDVSLWQTGITVGSGTMYIQPLVKNGNLLLHVRQVDLSALFFSLPTDGLDQQIEASLNQQLAASLAGLFTVTNVAIGIDKHIPCAASNSLILTGTTSMLS